MSKGLKLVILDECDAITSSAQFALRRVIEKYTKTTWFCLICNYVSKIIPALQSRCTRFRFSPLKPDAVELKLNEIAWAEQITLDRDAATAIVKLSEGDMRKVLNILESASMAHTEKVTIEDVYNCTGRPSPQEIDTIFESLLKDTMKASFEKILAIKIDRSLTLEDIVWDLHLVVMKSGLPKIHKIYVVIRLGEIEQWISLGCSEKSQIASLVGAFIEIRQMRKN